MGAAAMSVASERRIGRAMAEQVARVNGKAVFEDVAALHTQVERLQNLLQEERVKRAEAERVCEGYRTLLAHAGRHTVNGRPVLSVQEAAARAGVSIFTVYRYLKSGHWAGTDTPTCCVYADQPLAKKRQS